MDPHSLVSLIVAALAGGATAEAKQLGSKAVSDAYRKLKAHLIGKMGSPVVEDVEAKPTSTEALSEFTAKLKQERLESDSVTESLALALEKSLHKAGIAEISTSEGITVRDLRAKVNIIIASLEADGPIFIGSLTAEQGDINVGPIRAGTSKKN